ncbi:MAG: phosphoglucosamine mutase [Bryobacter sp.]
MARQLFGTDGIRGKAGEYPLDAATAFGLGAALGHWARHKSAAPRVLLGMDTRESGPWLAKAVAAGLRAAAVEPIFAGVITTPGVAYLTKTGDFVAGVMISASHNPYEDNGLKVFDHSGYKLPDAVELELEEQILVHRVGASDLESALEADASLDAAYLDYLAATFPHRLEGWRLVVDCAHGAASKLGPDLFVRLGADVVAVANTPNGRNINEGVGALHTDFLQREVLARDADLGVAFDGDADRALFVAASGRKLDGDAVLLVVGRALHEAGKLPGGRVVATVMSNLGLEVALRKSGLSMARAAVGDKYVLEEMIASGAALGGEQSGHLIFREYATTGDGLLTALQLLAALVGSGKTADELAADLEVYPQRLENVRVKERKPLGELAEVQAGIAECEAAFAGAGRVLVRYSGTELLARVMVEGNDADLVAHHAKRIAGLIAQSVGA